jgi:hypothetical protein
LSRKEQEPLRTKQWKSSARIQEEIIREKKRNPQKNGKHKTRDGFTHNPSSS